MLFHAIGFFDEGADEKSLILQRVIWLAYLVVSCSIDFSLSFLLGIAGGLSRIIGDAACFKSRDSYFYAHIVTLIVGIMYENSKPCYLERVEN